MYNQISYQTDNNSGIWFEICHLLGMRIPAVAPQVRVQDNRLEERVPAEKGKGIDHELFCESDHVRDSEGRGGCVPGCWP